jgi:penicillin-binding protein-related factor A (putative recombinase)
MAMNEASFSAQLREDLKEIYGNNIHVNLLPDMRMTGNKPYDFYFLYNRIFYSVECKIVKGLSINVNNNIKNQQYEKCNEVIKCGGIGLIAILFNREKSIIFTNTDSIVYISEFLVKDNLKYEDFLKSNRFVYSVNRVKFNNKTRWDVVNLISWINKK